MKVVVTGQVGMDKAAFLERAAALAAQAGHKVGLFHVGARMYAEAPDVPPGRILDLPLAHLTALRRSVFKDLLQQARTTDHMLVNTHATFRWRHGLFYAFDYDLIKALDADLYVVLVDDIDRVHARLLRDGHADHTLKDLMVWREEEMLTTELLGQIVRGHGCFYIQSRGRDDTTAAALVRLMFARHIKKAYLSFPMSHVVGNAAAGREIDEFRAEMKRLFTCFDPGDLEEKPLSGLALRAASEGHKFVTLSPLGRKLDVETSEILGILADIDGQIYVRDFKLIDQSDLIISLIPTVEDSGGAARPAISSGVERELQHAHESAKDVFVIWTCPAEPSPFVSATATKVFRSVAEAVRFFLANNYIPAPPPTGLFG